MPDSDMSDTQPHSIAPVGKKKFPYWLIAFILVLLIGVGLLGGYGAGMAQRYAAQDALANGQVQEQYQLGLEAVAAGQYEVAKQHFEYVILTDPNFPGVQAAYTDLLLRMQITPTVAPTSTPTITPTPDVRAVEEIYAQASALLSDPGPSLCERNWDTIISTVDSLRKADPTYHTAEVDGMYYIALRSRGICKILPQASRPNALCSDLGINLEGGIYDLTLAERFGPLDAQAESLRTYARMYIAGASFWDQDWQQARDIFSQVMAAYPNLSDASCDTATDRWREASLHYGEQILEAGSVCASQPYFVDAFTINSQQNEPFYPTATAIADECGEWVGTPTP